MRPKSGKNSKKEKAMAKAKKAHMAELTTENAMLKEEKEELLKSNEETKSKLEAISKKILDNIDRTEYSLPEGIEPLQIKIDVLEDMLTKIITKQMVKKKKSLAERIEELETRVTEQNEQIARHLRARSRYETCLSDILRCNDFNAIRAKVEITRLEIDEPPNILYPTTGAPAIVTSPANYMSLVNLNVTPERAGKSQMPICKFPGDTHIKQMVKELKIYIIRDLSMEKPSRSDWRLLALRTGIPEDVIQEWEEMKLECPCAYVFARWGESESATVRMLHRHLVSPQMRCSILGKRIADFYDIS